MTTVVRQLPGSDAGTVLGGVLGAVDFGVLYTSLDHTALACNVRFGEIFGISPERVVDSDPNEVRAMVRRRIADLEDWTTNLDEVYADPERIQKDRLQLVHPPAVLQRITAPVYDRDGKPVGRIWTFQDITIEDNRHRIRDSLHEASLVFEADPSLAYRRLTELVARHYDSYSFLSIRRNDFMEFRCLGGPPSPASTMKGHFIRDSYCQVCVSANSPVIVQDGRRDARTSKLLPVQLGVTRYMGVPVRDPYGKSIGTLCILDGRSDEILGPEDLSFMSQIAVRITGELDREERENAMRHDLERVQSRLIQSERLSVASALGPSIAQEIRGALAEDPAWLETIADRLLSYERPRETRLSRVQLSEVLDRVLARLETRFAECEIEIERQEEPGLPSIHADPVRLERALLNLAVDALDETPPGGTYRLRLWAESGQVRMEASDDRPETPLDPFDPFRQDVPADVALGLHAAREIIRESGGRLEAVPRPKGAVYRLEIPAA
ncbi:PAS domain-containing sensor histidine kinase [bacterium]|nr:MAG: PAS domain-containing sensor histidine kinase [bacterium]